MTRRGGDAVVAEYLPAGLDIYLGYVDGNYRSYDAIKARFPHALVVPIATQAGGDVGTVGDGPPDNGSWPEWVQWVARRRRAGVDPTMYTTASQWPTAVQAFNAAGVAQPHWWIAQWNGTATIPSGAIGHQYETVENHWDASVFADYWPGVDPKPTPAPAPKPVPAPTPTPAPKPTPPVIRKVKTMLVCYVNPQGTTNPGIWLLSGSLYSHIVSDADLKAITGAGVPEARISVAQHDALLTAFNALATSDTPAPGSIVKSVV